MRNALVYLGLLAASAVLSACGGGSGTTSSSTGTTTTAGTGGNSPLHSARCRPRPPTSFTLKALSPSAHSFFPSNLFLFDVSEANHIRRRRHLFFKKSILSIFVLEKSFFVYPNASYFEGKVEKSGIYTNEVAGLKYEGEWANE